MTLPSGNEMMKHCLILLSVLLSACSNLPKTITQAPINDIQLTEVRGKTQNFLGGAVRWGGVIVKVENEQNTTGIQVLSYPLGRYGRPRVNKLDTGRFFVTSSQFLDPAVYITGTEITVSGVLSGEVEKKIGNKTLVLPMVDSKDLHLWPDYDRYGYRYYGYGPYPYNHFGYYYPGFYYPGYRGYYRYRGCY